MIGAPPTDGSPTPPDPAGRLLDELLGSLLTDFEYWFGRGLQLLEHCPPEVLETAQRELLAAQLRNAAREIAAARALRRAAPTPMALEMEAMAPWHHLVLRVWKLSAGLRQAGVTLPESAPPP